MGEVLPKPPPFPVLPPQSGPLPLLSTWLGELASLVWFKILDSPPWGDPTSSGPFPLTACLLTDICIPSRCLSKGHWWTFQRMSESEVILAFHNQGLGKMVASKMANRITFAGHAYAWGAVQSTMTSHEGLAEGTGIHEGCCAMHKGGESDGMRPGHVPSLLLVAVTLSFQFAKPQSAFLGAQNLKERVDTRRSTRSEF